MEVKEKSKSAKSLDTLDLNGGEQVKIKSDIGLEEKKMADIASKVGTVLADTYILLVKTQCYHWNIRGNQFFGIHNLTEQQYGEIFSAIDTIAERMRALGTDAPGTMMEFLSLSSLDEAKKGLSQQQMITDLLKGHEEISKNIDHVRQVAVASKDEATADLMVTRLRFHEKAAWMWRSFLER